MFSYKLPLDPPCNVWEEYKKPAFILSKIQEICEKISQKGANCEFSTIFELIYEHVEDNIENFLSEDEYDDCI